MNSKERMKRAVDFGGPDMAAVDYWVLPAAYVRHGKALSDLLKKYPKDMLDPYDTDDKTPLHESHRKGDYTDPFGCVWHQECDGHLGQVSVYPLADGSAIGPGAFPPPETLEDGSTIQQLAKAVAAAPDLSEKYVAADFIRTFERMHFMRGMEKVLMDMLLGKDEFYKLLEAVAEWNLAHLKILLDELGGLADGVWFSDDWGTQKALLIKPDHWRKHFKPVYAKMFGMARERGKQVFFHSDGRIVDIIDDLIEAGVSVLNLQLTINDAATLRERFGNRVAFHTDLDRQGILPFGTSAEVKAHVRGAVEALATPGGGLILNAEIGGDIPIENIAALVEGFDEYRRPHSK